MKQLLLIDVSIYFFRYYFSMPDRWHSDEGHSSSAAYGYTTWLLRLLKQFPHAHAVACFDESLGTCFRNDIYSDYKCSRPPADADIEFQLGACRKVSELMGVACYSSSVFEADDLIGTIMAKVPASVEQIILSRDKDLAQLLSRKNQVLWDWPEGDRCGVEQLVEKLGVHPRQLADFLALTGDSIDDIPGVPGIGPKTAAELLKRFKNWKGIKKNLALVASLDIRGSRQLAEKLSQFEAQVDLSMQLTRIRCDAPLGRVLRTRRAKVKRKQLREYLRSLGFASAFADKASLL